MKTKHFFTVHALLFLTATVAFAQALNEDNGLQADLGNEEIASSQESAEPQTGTETVVFPETALETELNPVTGFPQIKQKPYFIFNEGISYTFVTRIEKQDDRSNFVYEDHLIGAFFTLQTENMRPANSIITVKAFYPFSHGFNGVSQNAKQVILYAVDLFAGPMLQTDMWKYVRIHFAAGLHYMYQLSDAYHLHYLGAGVLAGAELPIARHWTIIANGTFTLDNPNFGTNKLVQPFTYSWQYHLDVGVRYSKKSSNQFSYINSRRKKEKTPALPAQEAMPQDESLNNEAAENAPAAEQEAASQTEAPDSSQEAVSVE